MKKSVFFWLLMIWTSVGSAFSHTLSASNAYRDITLTIAGTLIDSLATDDTEIDSIVVRGPINDFDFSTLRAFAAISNNIVINLAYADVENKTIPEDAFSQGKGRDRIKRIILPNDIHTFKNGAFAYLSNLTDINMPTSLRELGIGTFQGCIKFSPDTLKIPEGVITIPRICFDNCFYLKHVVFPKSLKHIENMAFNMDFRIQSISFQEGLESIGITAFNGMQEIDSIRIPDSVKEIGERAFSENWTLKYLHIPTGITTIPFEFATSAMLDSIYIPDNVVTIQEGAFDGILCSYLRLSENLTTIERKAFREHRLTEILLPASLQFIGNKALPADRLKKVYCPANIPPALESTDKGEWAFAGCNDNTTLFVPVGCGDTYRNTPGWNNFSRIEEIEQFPSSIEQVNDATTWTATGGKGMIHLQNNTATTVRLNVYTLGGELNKSIELQSRTAIEVAPGSYLINDGQHAKTVIVK